jgi:hypothetical protein
MEALATAEVNTQFNASYIYVSRREEETASGTSTQRQERGRVPELNLVEPGSSQELMQQGVPGDSTATAPKRDIPEPCEPAQKFESEREMLELISPQASGVWPQSGRVNGSVTSASKAEEDVTASVLPGGFRLLGPAKPSGSRKIASQGIVQTPVEFGAVPSLSAGASAADSKAPDRMEWIYDGTRRVPRRRRYCAGDRATTAAHGPGRG